MIPNPVVVKALLLAILKTDPITLDKVLAHYIPFDEIDMRSFNGLSNVRIFLKKKLTLITCTFFSS
jgi:hypothetical protein